MGKGETTLISAIREFEEETGISKDKYKILFKDENIKTVKDTVEYTFIDNGVRYKYIYYMAVIDSTFKLNYDYSNEHMLQEICDIRFLSLNYIKEMNNNRLYKICKIIVNKVKKFVK